MSQTPNPSDIRAEITRLQNQLMDMGENPDEIPLEIGTKYYLLNGEAEVTGFYEEDGIHKIQAKLRPLHPVDGVTVKDEEGILFSTPIPRFRKLMAEFERDQKTRQQLASRPFPKSSGPAETQKDTQ